MKSLRGCCANLLLKCGEPLAERIDAGVLLPERINLTLLRGYLVADANGVGFVRGAGAADVDIVATVHGVAARIEAQADFEEPRGCLKRYPRVQDLRLYDRRASCQEDMQSGCSRFQS